MQTEAEDVEMQPWKTQGRILPQNPPGECSSADTLVSHTWLRTVTTGREGILVALW